MADFSTLVDDFEDGSFDTAKWSRTSSTTVVESDGRVTIDADSEHYINYGSRLYPATNYNLDGSSVYFKIDKGTAGNFHVFIHNSNRGYVFRMVGGPTRIAAGIVDNGSAYGFSSFINYSATTMAYLRFRSDGSGAYAEYSEDTSSWTLLKSWTNSDLNVDRSSMRVLFYGDGGGVLHVESVNTPPAPPDTIVTVENAAAATAQAMVPDVVAPPATTILAPAMRGAGTDDFEIPTITTTKQTVLPPALTATATAPVPELQIGPPPTTIDAVSASAQASALAPEVFLVTTIVAVTASVSGRFPAPVGGEQGFPYVAMPARATASMIAPLGGDSVILDVPSMLVFAQMLLPSLATRPALDSWQVHDDFEGDELSDIWEVGYQGLLLPEGPGGPAPSIPLTQVPFIIDGEMTLQAGTIIQTRDWTTFGEWAYRVEMNEIPTDSDVIVAMGLFAAYGELPGYPYSAEYEAVMAWYSYIVNGRRYVYRGWGVYSPNWDDSFSEEYDPDPYNPVAILTSPHSRSAQNMTKADSGDLPPGGGSGQGYVPYWPMKGPYNNSYEARPLKLVIQVTGPAGSSVTITGINVRPPATRIAIPTATLVADVDAIVDHTYPRLYTGVIGPKSMKPPVMRTTARFLKPADRAVMLVENAASLGLAVFLSPENAGLARPVQVFPMDAVAFASLIPPILIGEPVDVVVEGATAFGTARAVAPNTSGTIKKAFGITAFQKRKMAIKIEFHKMELGIGARELVSA